MKTDDAEAAICSTLPTHVSEDHRMRIENFELKRRLLLEDLESMSNNYLALMTSLGASYQFDGDDAVDYSSGLIIRKGV